MRSQAQELLRKERSVMSGKTLIQYVEQFYRDGMVTVEGVFSADEAAA